MSNEAKDVAVIIGGDSGLGLGAARRFIENGCQVVIGGRSEDKVSRSAGILGPKARGLIVDVTDQASVESFFKEAGKFDHLVVTASAGGADKPLRDTTIEELKVFADTKLWGTVRCVKAAQQYISKAGSVTFITGVLSKKGRAGAHAKAIANGALEGLLHSLVAEFGPRIRVNCISPSYVDSNGTMNPAKKEEFRRLYPVGYVGDADDVASIIYAVATNRFMTGSVVGIDGGWASV